MSSILSQEEIETLLTSARGASRGGDAAGIAALDEGAPYNFRRPDRISKEQVRSIHLLHDRFARDVATSLSAYLRIGTEVTLVSVDTLTYSEFLMSLPDPTAFCSLGLAPVDGLGALELNPGVAFAMIDRMLGGRGPSQPANRALTEIEQNVVDGIIRLLLENLTATWRRSVDVEFRIHARETRPQVLQVAAPGDAMVGVAFEVRLGDARGALNLCLPSTLVASLPQGWQNARREPSATESKHLARNLARVEVPLTAVLRARLEASDILAMRPGDVISLGRGLREPLEVLAWGTPALLARPTRTENGLALSVCRRAGDGESEATT